MYPDDTDRKLLSLVQREFPLSQEPFASLGAKIDISGEEVLHRIRRLKADGIIHQISPVLDARRLGYQATLAAMSVTPENLARAAEIISEHPGVSHCYQREHCFNLWFTLALPAQADTQSESTRLSKLAGADRVLNLPPLKVFKIGAYFDIAGDGWRTPVSKSSALPKRVKLSSLDRTVLNQLQQDLPLVEKPFEPMAVAVGLDADQFLGQCQTLQKRGLVRRFSASINHIGAGFIANALVCWMVPPEMVESTGKRLATFSEVSHCFERQTSPLWKYNLYTVILSGQRRFGDDQALPGGEVVQAEADGGNAWGGGQRVGIGDLFAGGPPTGGVGVLGRRGVGLGDDVAGGVEEVDEDDVILIDRGEGAPVEG